MLQKFLWKASFRAKTRTKHFTNVNNFIIEIIFEIGNMFQRWKNQNESKALTLSTFQIETENKYWIEIKEFSVSSFCDKTFCDKMKYESLFLATLSIINSQKQNCNLSNGHNYFGFCFHNKNSKSCFSKFKLYFFRFWSISEEYFSLIWYFLTTLREGMWWREIVWETQKTVKWKERKGTEKKKLREIRGWGWK